MELDRRGLCRVGEAVGQPAAIERPRHALDAPIRAAVQLAHAGRLAAQVDQLQLVAVIGQRHGVTRGRYFEIDHATDIEAWQRLRGRRAVGDQDREDLSITVAIGRGGDQPLVVVQPGQHAVAHPVGFAMLGDRPLPVMEGERFAPRGDGQAGAIGAQRGAVQETLRGYEAAIALRP